MTSSTSAAPPGTPFSGSDRVQIRACPRDLQFGDTWSGATIIGYWGLRMRGRRAVAEVAIVDSDNRQYVVELGRDDELTVWRRVRPQEAPVGPAPVRPA